MCACRQRKNLNLMICEGSSRWKVLWNNEENNWLCLKDPQSNGSFIPLIDFIYLGSFRFTEKLRSQHKKFPHSPQAFSLIINISLMVCLLIWMNLCLDIHSSPRFPDFSQWPFSVAETHPKYRITFVVLVLRFLWAITVSQSFLVFHDFDSDSFQGAGKLFYRMLSSWNLSEVFFVVSLGVQALVKMQ